MDIVIPPGVTDLGLGGLVAMGLLLIFFGKLIPRSVHEDRVGDLKAQLTEKDATITYLQTALDKRDAQVDKMLSDAQISTRAIESIQREAAGKA